MLGGGKYEHVARAARRAAGARGVILWVLDGYQGHGFECQLPPENLPQIVNALREVADKLEQDIQHQSLVSATSKERAGQQ
jgi:hypothetical protein